MLYGARPIDKMLLAVEVLALGFIVYEFFSGRFHRWKTHRRVKRIRRCFATGQQLQSDAKNKIRYGGPEEPMRAWIQSVTDWTQETDTQLKRYSVQASQAFQYDPGAMFNPLVADLFEPTAKATYLRLQHCLNNLRQIMEKPDVYL
jgi:hypothetical protein